MDPRHNQPPFLDKRSILTSLEDHSNVALDLGCGVDKLPHAIGIDSTDAPSVDVVGDVLVVLRSLPDASVDHIYTRHFLEHVPDLMGILQECVRVLRPGGELDVVVPHFSNPYYYSDPTHARFFGLYSFEYLAATAKPVRREIPSYARAFPQLSQTSVRLELWSPFLGRKVVKRLVTVLVNLNRWTQELYEENFCWLLPCYQVSFQLRRTPSPPPNQSSSG